MSTEHRIVEYDEEYRDDLVELWEVCGLTRPWNDPGKDIERKLSDPVGDLFLLLSGERLIGSVMVGYDGHRGSVNYLAVHPEFQKKKLGKMLMAHSENYLLELGCPKLNLMVRTSNIPVIAFYEGLGYQKDDVIVFSKRLIDDK